MPGLAQYWQPVLLDAEVSGEACVAGRPIRLDGARAYAEKNWGPGFAGRWWWGHAGAFGDGDLSVAFAGGRLPLLGAEPAPTAAVLRIGAEVIALRPPIARARVSTGGLGWRLRMRSARYSLELEGEPDGNRPHTLPVPEPGPPHFVLRSQQLLAGGIALRVQARAAHDHRRTFSSCGPGAWLSARLTTAPSASELTSRSNGPTAAQRARRRSSAPRSTAATRASETSSASYRPTGSTQCANSTRTVPGSPQSRKASASGRCG